MQIVLVVLAPLLALSLVIGLLWLYGRQTAPRKASAPPGIRSYVTFFGAERYAGPSESLEETVTCGRGILEKIADGLTKDGLETGRVIDEDWGALLQVTGPDRRLHICSGFRGDDWLVFVCTPRGPNASLADSALLRKLLTSIDASLKNLPGIARVAWHHVEHFDAGREDLGSPAPLST
jgi:hypothetical protein